MCSDKKGGKSNKDVPHQIKQGRDRLKEEELRKLKNTVLLEMSTPKNKKSRPKGRLFT
jgi:hypothetical protein